MKRLSTFLLLAFLGITTAKAQSDLLYVAGQNDATPGDAPTLYVQDSADLYVQGGVVLSGTNSRGDGLVQTNGTIHVGADDSTGTPIAGNWTNNTGGSVYTYSKTSVPSNSTYAPGYPAITYGKHANTVSLEYGNQLIVGGTVALPNSVDTSYFFNLSLLDSAVNRTSVHSYKALVGASIYVGNNSAAPGGMLDLNDEYLNTQNFNVYVLNPSTATSGVNAAISRLYNGILDNSLPFSNPYNSIAGGMVIASNVAIGEFSGRLVRYTTGSGTYVFPVGTLVNMPAGGEYGTGQAYDLFRPAAIASAGTKSFGVALAARDGFVDAGTALDQSGTAYNSLAGINHEYYYKINQLSGAFTNTDQITLTHDFYNNSTANDYPNWSTCGNLPDLDFPQTLTIAQWNNDPSGGYPVSWNDVCHGDSVFHDIANSCGAVIVTPDSGFCSTTVEGFPPFLSSTTTVAYQIPGMYYGASGPGDNPQEDYTVAGQFFTVDGGNGSCDGNCAALPINIISLTGWNIPNENANEVQWITATEENIDYFLVEKSIDGINFTNISGNNGVPAKGVNSNTQETYDFTDNMPNIGHNYYRVQEFNYMNQSVMTNVIDVPLNKAITIANIYPNPTSGALNVAFETASTGTVHVEIYDVLGRLVMSNDNAVAEGNNIITLNTESLTAGSYFIRLTDAASGFTDTQKFIKITE